jgi:hypothetical protein
VELTSQLTWKRRRVASEEAVTEAVDMEEHDQVQMVTVEVEKAKGRHWELALH